MGKRTEGLGSLESPVLTRGEGTGRAGEAREHAEGKAGRGWVWKHLTLETADEKATSVVQPGEREVIRLDLGKIAGEWQEGGREGPGHGREIRRPGMSVGLSPRWEK